MEDEEFNCQVCYKNKPIEDKRNATKDNKNILACRECCEENHKKAWYASL